MATAQLQGLFATVVHEAPPDPAQLQGLFTTVVHESPPDPAQLQGLFTTVVHANWGSDAQLQGLFTTVVHESPPDPTRLEGLFTTVVAGDPLAATVSNISGNVGVLATFDGSASVADTLRWAWQSVPGGSAIANQILPFPDNGAQFPVDMTGNKGLWHFEVDSGATPVPFPDNGAATPLDMTWNTSLFHFEAASGASPIPYPDNGATTPVDMTDNLGLYHFETTSGLTQVPFPDNGVATPIDMTANEGLWHFEGNANDTSGNARNGTVTGATQVAGKVGSFAYYFNGTSDYIDYGAILAFTTGDFTFSFWMNPNASQVSWAKVFGCQGAGAGDGYAFENHSANHYRFQSGDGSSWFANGNTMYIPPGRWSHITLVRVGQVITGYLDGVAVYTDVAPTTIADLADFEMGRQTGASAYWEGILDEFAVWSRALSPVEIADIYTKQLAPQINDTSGQSAWLQDVGTTQTAGVVGSFARAFNGTDQYIQGNIPNAPTTEGSWAGWFKINAGVAAYDMIAGFAPWSTSPNGTARGLLYHNSGYLYWWGYNADQSLNNAKIVLGQWHHLAVSWENTDNVKVYLDGTMYYSMTHAGLNTPSNQFWIGARPDTTDYTPMECDEIAIWDRVISEAEVAAIYSKQSAGQIRDSSGSAGNLVDHSTTQVTGKVGSFARAFNGTDQYINGPILSPDSPVVPFPDNGAVTPIDMTDNKLLFHFEGNANDTSGEGHNMAVVGSPAVVPGKVGSFCYDFPGTNTDYLSTPYPPGAPKSFQITGDATASFWLNADSIGPHNTESMILLGNPAYADEADNVLFFVRWATTAGDLEYTHQSGPGSGFTRTQSHVFNTNLSAGVWYHLVFVRDTTAKTITLYIDGVLSGVGTYLLNPTGGSNGSFASGYMIDGRMDEMALWSRALPASEVADIYRKQQGSHVSLHSGSLSCWFKRVSGTASRIIVGLADNRVTKNGTWRTISVNNNLLQFWGYSDDINNIHPITLGQWYHAVVTWENTNDVKVYLDGVLQASHTLTLLPPPAELWMGAEPHNSNYTDMELDEVAVWGRAISETEVVDIYVEQAAGILGDTSGQGVNLVNYGTTQVAGRVGAYARAFNGTDQWVQGVVPNAPTTDGTISAWVKLGANTQYRIICGFGDDRQASVSSMNGTWRFLVVGNTAGQLGFYGYNNDTTNLGTLNVGTWHHVACVWSSTTYLEVYLDGVRVANQTIAGLVVPSSQFWMGARPDNTNRTNMELDEVAVWNRALSQTEIQTIYDFQNTASYAGGGPTFPFTPDVIGTYTVQLQARGSVGNQVNASADALITAAGGKRHLFTGMVLHHRFGGMGQFTAEQLPGSEDDD